MNEGGYVPKEFADVFHVPSIAENITQKLYPSKRMNRYRLETEDLASLMAVHSSNLYAIPKIYNIGKWRHFFIIHEYAKLERFFADHGFENEFRQFPPPFGSLEDGVYLDEFPSNEKVQVYSGKRFHTDTSDMPTDEYSTFGSFSGTERYQNKDEQPILIAKTDGFGRYSYSHDELGFTRFSRFSENMIEFLKFISNGSIQDNRIAIEIFNPKKTYVFKQPHPPYMTSSAINERGWQINLIPEFVKLAQLYTITTFYRYIGRLIQLTGSVDTVFTINEMNCIKCDQILFAFDEYITGRGMKDKIFQFNSKSIQQRMEEARPDVERYKAIYRN